MKFSFFTTATLTMLFTIGTSVYYEVSSSDEWNLTVLDKISLGYMIATVVASGFYTAVAASSIFSRIARGS